MTTIDFIPGVKQDYRDDWEIERDEYRKKLPGRHYDYKPGTTVRVKGFFRCPDCGIPGVEIRPDFMDCTCCGSDATQW